MSAFYCRLDAVSPVLDTLSPPTIAGRHMLAHLYRTLTTVRTAVQTAVTGSGPRTTRMFKRADKKLSRFIVDVDDGVRRQQIPPDSGDRITNLASVAYDSLTLLRSTTGAAALVPPR